MPPSRSSSAGIRSRHRARTEDALPIYAEIQRDIESKIISGEWRPGDRVPVEHELVKVYGCSRMTVNKALSGLAAAGVIVRKRRNGSFVSPPRVNEPLLTIQDIRAEVLSLGRDHTFNVTSRSIRTVTDPIDAQHVGVEVGSRVLSMELVHFADRLPFALETRQINLASVPEAERQPFLEEPPGSWLLQHVPWSDAEHNIRAIVADGVIGKALHIEPGSACMTIARRTWRLQKLITFVRLVYPGERHRFNVRFSSTART